MRQFTVTATKTFTYHKTVIADNIVEAHIKAHEPVEDPIDDWTCYWDADYDDETPDNGELVIQGIEDEGEHLRETFS